MLKIFLVYQCFYYFLFWSDFFWDSKNPILYNKVITLNMSATKREEVSSHLRYIRLELREMHQMLIKEDLLPDLNEAKEVHAQLDALLDLISDKRVKNMKNQFGKF